MTRLALRLVRIDGPPSYRLAPARLRRRLAVWRQRRDRRREVAEAMRSNRASIRVTCSDDLPGNYLLPGTAWRGSLAHLPRPLRRKARQALHDYFCTSPISAADYPWTPLPGDPRGRVSDVRYS